jgi:hypothetical protein
MSQIISFYTNSVTNWSAVLCNPTFKSLSAPVFDCAEYEGIEVKNWLNLNIQQPANKARAGGVDTNNINGLISELQVGYRVTELPPILMILPNGEEEVWDGYNRYNACYELGITDYPFIVYRLKEEWANSVDDAYDIISLGANNHTVAKRHTINDFVNRGVCYVKRNGSTSSKDEIKTWVDSISHSFTPKQVSDIVDKIYQQTTIAVNIAPYVHPKNAQQKVAEIVQTGSSTNPVIICCKENTYIERGFLQIMKNFVESDIKETDVVTYTKGCETAEDVIKQREDAVKYLNKLDALVVQYVTKRLTTQSSAYSVAGSLPQLLGVEDPQSLVNV